MKNKEIISLANALNSIEEIKGLSLNLLIEQNIENLKPFILPLTKILTGINDKLKDFEKERIELVKTFCKLDEDGNEMLLDKGLSSERYDIINMNDFNKSLEELRKKHKKDLDLYEKETKEFEDSMDKDSKFKPELIDKKLLPKDISRKNFKILYPLIKK